MKEGRKIPKRINVALIGCGRIMPAHLHGYKALLEKDVDVRIAALVARKPGDAERFRRRGEGPPPRQPVGPPGDPLNVPHIYVYDFQKDFPVETYTDYREMLKRADIDAVEIYTSVLSHHTIAIDSLNAGKHVLVEKPIAITVKAARRMVEAAEKARKVLGVAENTRYFPDIRMTKWVIDEGYIGDVQMVLYGILGGWWSPDKIVAETAWRHKKMFAGGGATIDMGVHLFHILRYLCGEVDEVSSIVRTIEKVRVTRDKAGKVMESVTCEVDDTFFALITFETGAIGTVFFSWAGHGEPTTLPGIRAIYGTKGCIKGENLILDDGTRINIRKLFEKEASREVKEKFFPYGITDPMALETLEFLRAIWDRREMETSGREGLRDLAASYALIESSLLKRSVKVDDVESGIIGEYEKEINEYYKIV
ncbi:gfo/Idh/MocA family oxidoreductase [Candidatus Bathyarchaeota archaeon]|nr:MAG: oxidoreductase [Candidatus Bathyarchaeota archaeon ex4484_40]RJS78606.1 MAG: gfo/Idh/MocA family oxidoreductase [Candidatus Bathyarchaeota archaeon]